MERQTTKAQKARTYIHLGGISGDKYEIAKTFNNTVKDGKITAQIRYINKELPDEFYGYFIPAKKVAFTGLEDTLATDFNNKGIPFELENKALDNQNAITVKIDKKYADKMPEGYVQEQPIQMQKAS